MFLFMGLFLYKYEKRMQTKLKWVIKFKSLITNKYNIIFENYYIGINSPVSRSRFPLPYLSVNFLAISDSSLSKEESWVFKKSSWSCNLILLICNCPNWKDNALILFYGTILISS